MISSTISAIWMAQLVGAERRGDRDVDALHQHRHYLLLDLLFALVLGLRAFRVSISAKGSIRSLATEAAVATARAGGGDALGADHIDDLAQQLTLLGQRRLRLWASTSVSALRSQPPRSATGSPWRGPRGREPTATARLPRNAAWTATRGGLPAGRRRTPYRWYATSFPAAACRAGLHLFGHAGELDTKPVQVAD